MTIAEHGDPHDFDLRSADLHAHILVGGLPYDELVLQVNAWPGFFHIQRVYNRWGILHYVLDQTKDPTTGKPSPRLHGQDVDSHCHSLVVPPIWSDNIDVFEAQILEGQKDARRKRAQAAARARWASGT